MSLGNQPPATQNLLNETDYLNAVSEFDQLWESAPTPYTRSRSDQLLNLIRAYETNQSPETTNKAA
jgi:hypothetical protein